MNRIHLSKIWAEMESKDDRGNPVPFSFQYAKKDGTLGSYSHAVLSSATINMNMDIHSNSEYFILSCIILILNSNLTATKFIHLFYSIEKLKHKY